jgi:hypothetical protein
MLISDRKNAKLSLSRSISPKDVALEADADPSP